MQILIHLRTRELICWLTCLSLNLSQTIPKSICSTPTFQHSRSWPGNSNYDRWDQDLMLITWVNKSFHRVPIDSAIDVEHNHLSKAFWGLLHCNGHVFLHIVLPGKCTNQRMREYKNENMLPKFSEQAASPCVISKIVKFMTFTNISVVITYQTQYLNREIKLRLYHDEDEDCYVSCYEYSQVVKKICFYRSLCHTWCPPQSLLGLPNQKDQPSEVWSSLALSWLDPAVAPAALWWNALWKNRQLH